MVVLDLGAAPGSWTQFASEKIGPKGRVVAIDLEPLSVTLPNVVSLEANIFETDWTVVLEPSGLRPEFDLVLSDMAPKTTGIRFTDQTRSMELCEKALEVAEKTLRKDGTFVCKLFHGAEFKNFQMRLKKTFERVEILRPESTRKESKEIYFIALNFAGK